MKLSSGLNRELLGNFVLDEDGLRRIVGVMQTKAATMPLKTAIVLVVNREDDRFYETLNVEDVLSDPNTAGHLIKILTIELRVDDPTFSAQPWAQNWLAKVVYSSTRKSQIQINVNSEDKTWALMLADELEPQIRRTRSSDRISTTILILFFLALGIFSGTSARNLLPVFGISNSMIDKVVLAIGGVTFLLIMNAPDDRPTWLTHFAGPQTAFNWGDSTKTYNAAVERQKNFFWVVIVGLIVSVVSTVYTTYALPVIATSSKPSSGASAP